MKQPTEATSFTHSTDFCSECVRVCVRNAYEIVWASVLYDSLKTITFIYIISDFWKLAKKKKLIAFY